MHHFFVTKDQVNQTMGYITIHGNDVNHIKNVLRMRNEEELLISDGEGHDYMCKLAEIETSEEVLHARIVQEQFEGSELASKIFLFQGLPKSDKIELIIQKAVELGAYEIIPVATKRCVVKLDEKKQKNKILRWNSISESAAKQSRRSIIPQVKEVMRFSDAINYAKTLDIIMIPYENYKDMSKTKEIIGKVEKNRRVGIFIGPEGGFDENEVEEAIKNGVQPISLGKRILRTETAGLMLISVLMFQLED